ncbi:hypothetical protein [Streptosporangium sp. NPDC051022]|uniref:hypothetical protein n=1 Tax=Streptosporangium sp. NPDC051022 TaxID=3155752 RepID=UPI00341C14DF
MKIRMTCTGTRPLLLHNVQLASPLNPYAKKLKALNSKRVKTDEDRLEVARVEFEGSLYYDVELGPVMPSQNVFRCLIGGARLIKAGKKIERGVAMADFQLPLIYQGPRDIEGLWGGGESEFVDIRPVTVQRNKVDRCRPIFRSWVVEADIVIDPKAIEFDEFCEVARLAGEMEGLGDFRTMFGRFDAQVSEI